MAGVAYILCPGAGAWKVGSFGAGGESVVDVPLAGEGEVAGVAEALKRMGYGGEGVMLAAPAGWCLAAGVSTDDLPRGDRRAMLYRLEEKLPVSAEEVVADFVPGGGEALGVCAVLERVRPWVLALEAKRVAVESISPMALLAARGVVGEEVGINGVVLVGEGERVNVVEVLDGRPVRWGVVAADAEDLRIELAVAGAGRGVKRVIAFGVGAEVVNGVFAGAELCEVTPVVAAGRAARGVLEGTSGAWVELRRGVLGIADPLRFHRHAIDAVLAAAAVLLLAIGGVALVRGQRYARAAEARRGEVAAEFRRAFPDWAPPANAKAVLESEYRRASQQAGAALPAEASASALETMGRVLGGIKPELRVRVDRMSFDDDAFSLEGAVRSYEDVGGVVAAARAAGWEVSTPQARRDATGAWTFIVRGSRSAGGGTPVARGGGRE